MRFTKVESVGNDYVLFDAIEEPSLAHLDDLTHHAQVLSHRRTGVGADGLLILTQQGDDLAMRVINADGSDGGVCGNGLRCAAKLAIERGYVSPDGDDAIRIAVGGRTVAAQAQMRAGAISSVRVDMGPPMFAPQDIPIDPAIAEDLRENRWRVDEIELRCASMGNPHAVLFVQSDAPRERSLKTLGERLGEHEAFPERTNVHIATIADTDRVRVDSWERGAGATLGCGTGVCAVVALGVRAGMLAEVCRVEVPGGSLVCGWSGEQIDGVWLEGPAREVFTGEWSGSA